MSQNYQIQWKRLHENLELTKDDRSLFLSAIEIFEAWLLVLESEQIEKAVDFAIDISGLVKKEFGLRLPSVIAVILWQPYIDGFIEEKDVDLVFGESILSLLQGIQKIEKMDTSKTEIHSENFIQLILSLSSDIRVVLLKTAERLHSVRGLETQNTKIQQKIAKEVSSLYGPIAHRMGLYLVKMEFEEAGMKYLNSEDYKSIATKLNETRKSREQYIQNFIRPLQEKLKKSGYIYEINGRPKSINSIWHKMKAQGVEFEEVYDLFAIRIVLDGKLENEKADCWQVYSVVTDHYMPNPNRLRDWISSPKINGYESLHTTVIGADGKWVEVQIRTRRMNEIAEHGHAAHWKYKDNKQASQSMQDDTWLGSIRTALESPDIANTQDEHDTKTELYSNQIYIFTPQNDLIKLRAGSCILDFAFAIHTKVGYHCTGAKVNGRIVPIKYTLINGDQVEILTSAQQKPKSDWLNLVKTSKARTRIKMVLKQAEFKNSDEGKETLKRKFEQWRIKYDVTTIHRLVNFLNLKNALEMYQQVADNKVDLTAVRDWLREKDPAEYLKEKIVQDKRIDSFNKSTVRQEDCLIINDTLDRIDFKLSKCCNPIFGDEVFGFITVGEGTKIHRMNCPNAKQMISRYPYRVVKVRWTENHVDDAYYTVNIRLTGMDDIGIINEVSKVISSDLRVNMRAMKIHSDDGFFTGQITLAVSDRNHLNIIIKKINQVKGIMTVQRSDDQ